LFFIWPIAALFLVLGLEWKLYLAAVVLMLVVATDNQRFHGGKRWHGLFFPAGLLVLDYVLIRSMIVTLWQRGITWRGTHYPLNELRDNQL